MAKFIKSKSARRGFIVVAVLLFGLIFIRGTLGLINTLTGDSTYSYTQETYKEVELPGYLRLTSSSKTGDPIDSPSQEGWSYQYESSASNQQTLNGIITSLKAGGYSISSVRDGQILNVESSLQQNQNISFTSTNNNKHLEIDVSLTSQQITFWIYKLSN